MNNKTKTYLLLAAVLSIWGIIGFKMFSTLNPDTPLDIPQDNKVTFKPKTSTEIDTFSIQTTNRDPFLGTLYKKKKAKVKTKPTRPKPALVWPSITYHGAVAKQQSKAKVFVVSINGNQHIMRVGQQMDGVKLIRAVSKIITVTYKGAIKTVTKL